MKKSYLIGMFVVLLNSVSAQWMSQNSGTTQHLHSVCFTDVNTGYTVGDSGIILKTVNGGTNWSKLTSGTTKNLFSVSFGNDTTGYISGEKDQNCLILKTTNRGGSWSRVTVQAYPFTLYSISCNDADTILAVGASPFVTKTLDGGIHWYTLGPAPGDTFYSVQPTNGMTVYYVGNYGFIIKNGLSQPSGSTDNLYSVHFPEFDTGFVVGAHGTILKTLNSGMLWLSQSSPVSTSLRSVYFSDTQTGYAVGDSGVIIKTENGGTAWANQNSTTINHLRSVFFPATDTGYAVGDNGTILKTINGGGFPLSDENPSITSHFLEIYPDPSSDRITIKSSESQPQLNLSIVNLNGQECLNITLRDLSTQIDIRNLQNGIYFVKLKGDHIVQIGKIIKM